MIRCWETLAWSFAFILGTMYFTIKQSCWQENSTHRNQLEEEMLKEMNMGVYLTFDNKWKDEKYDKLVKLNVSSSSQCYQLLLDNIANSYAD